MSGVFKSLRRMVSWSRSQEEVPQLPKEAHDQPDSQAPPAPKSGKRKFAASDDEADSRVDSLSKRAKPDSADVAEDGSLPGESSAAPAEPAAPEPEPEHAAPAEPAVSEEKESATKDDAEDEPKPAPDSPEPEPKAEDDFVFPALSETAPNVFLTWADGLIHLLDDIDIEPPVLWLKSQILDAYKAYLDDGAQEPEDVEDGVGYCGVEIDDDAKDTPLAKDFVAAWAKARQGTTSDDAWWWELTLVREEPKDDTPRIRARLESSTHNEEHEVYGGKQLGDWWIVGVQPASPDAAKVMTMHRALY